MGRGCVLLVGAPLDHPDDASMRLREALSGSDIIAADDPERVLGLAHDLAVPLTGAVVPLSAVALPIAANDLGGGPDLLALAQGGATVAVVTSGSVPGLSSPGFQLVRAALESGVPVEIVPGPSAVTTALALSGLPSERFCVEGRLPASGPDRQARLAELAAEERTTVLVGTALAEDLVSALGPDRAAVAVVGGEVRRGPLGELASFASATASGAVTLVLAGATPAPAPPPDAARLAAEVASEESTGTTRKQAIASVAARYALPKRDVYDAVLQHRPRP